MLQHSIMLPCACVLLLTQAEAHSGRSERLTNVRFENVTPEGVPLEFAPEKVKWEHKRLSISGVVKNTGDSPHEKVSVSFTALDKDKKTLGQATSTADPMWLKPGESRRIRDASIDTAGRIPVIIQFVVDGAVG
jgi:hypothetical protein